MSQIEHDFRQFLSKHPEIEKCYSSGLINRRSLARYLIKEGIAKQNQFDAMIAMLRRFKFKDNKNEGKDLFKDIKVNIKDKILVLEFEKEKELLKRLQNVIAHTNYDKGDTLKIVVGTAAIKIFIELAKQFSTASNASDGGDLGLFDITNFSKEIKEKISKLNKGQYTDVITTAQGFQIFYLQDIVLEGKQPYEQASKGIGVFPSL